MRTYLFTLFFGTVQSLCPQTEAWVVLPIELVFDLPQAKHDSKGKKEHGVKWKVSTLIYNESKECSLAFNKIKTGIDQLTIVIVTRVRHRLLKWENTSIRNRIR